MYVTRAGDRIANNTHAHYLLAASAVRTRQQVVAALHVAVVTNPAGVTLAVVRAACVVLTTQTVSTTRHLVAIVNCQQQTTTIKHLHDVLNKS